MIGTNFDTKLRTSLAGKAYIPDITYINSNNALYFTNEDLFLDLDELGADAVKSDFYEWKWELGITPKGRFCFFPLDIGPTGFFYRQDIFEDAGLPSSPEDVSAAITTWEDWIALGAELKDSAGSFLVNDAQNIFEGYLNSSPERYFDTDDNALYLEDGSAVRRAWDVTITAIEAGLTAKIPRDRAPIRTRRGLPDAPRATSARRGGRRSSPSPLRTPREAGGSPHSRSAPGTTAAPSPRSPTPARIPRPPWRS